MVETREGRGRRPPSGARLWLFRAVGIAITLLVLFVVCEVFVRALGLAPVIHRIELDAEWATFEASPNPILVYVPKPDSGDINSYGIREHPFEIDKAPGTRRIVVIGDSFAFGLGIDDLDDAFAKKLEQELRARRSADAPQVEVLNLGVSGYDTEQQVEFFREKGAVLDPDLVIVSFCLNDYVDSSWERRRILNDERQSGNRELTDAIRRNAIYRSHLVRFLAAKAGRLGSGDAAQEAEAAAAAGDAGPNRVQRGFAELRRMADAQGFSVLVMIWPDLMGFENYRFGQVHADTHENARAVGFDLLDLYTPFLQVTGMDASSIRQPDGHPNIAGHALAARLTADHLLRGQGDAAEAGG